MSTPKTVWLLLRWPGVAEVEFVGAFATLQSARRAAEIDAQRERYSQPVPGSLECIWKGETTLCVQWLLEKPLANGCTRKRRYGEVYEIEDTEVQP